MSDAPPPLVERARRAETPRADAPVHVLVVGSGIAGLTAALHAQRAGARVTLVTKDALEHANTRFAQGGVAAVVFEGDRADDHIRDTLVAGAGLCDPDAVRVLVEEGAERIRELIALGVAFDTDAEGALVGGLEAAHSFPRILHAGGDATGSEIERALVAAVRGSGADVIEHAFLIDLVVEGGRVVGADLLIGDATRRALHADAVVLATGGAGRLYAHTTNPPVATGDGIAAALRVGAEVADLEFFQFHPTVLAQGEAFLVSEAVRGEGATLIDDEGRRFAFDAHPDGELAPRDVVARAIARRMLQQGVPVRLDATALGAEFLARRFPTIDAAVRRRGMDWARAPIPVTPAAHYLMGGVVTDLDGGTSVPGLFAVGEVARTGVHGANRLASNSLLEGAVFGARAGAAAAAASSSSSSSILPTLPPTVAEPTRVAAPGIHPRPFPSGRHSEAVAEPTRVAVEPARWRPDASGRHSEAVGGFSREALQALMWECAGLERTEAGLARAAATIDAWDAASVAPVTEAEHEDANLLLVARHLIAAARARTASVGAHFRSDEHPEPTAHLKPTARLEPAAHPESTAQLEPAAHPEPAAQAEPPASLTIGAPAC